MTDPVLREARLDEVDEIDAGGGWSRGDKLYTGSGDAGGDPRFSA